MHFSSHTSKLANKLELLEQNWGRSARWSLSDHGDRSQAADGVPQACGWPAVKYRVLAAIQRVSRLPRCWQR